MPLPQAAETPFVVISLPACTSRVRTGSSDRSKAFPVPREGYFSTSHDGSLGLGGLASTRELELAPAPAAANIISTGTDSELLSHDLQGARRNSVARGDPFDH
jgi:hypothetical protein